jgi:ribosomal-protein-alanine N-acetyltransferase
MNHVGTAASAGSRQALIYRPSTMQILETPRLILREFSPDDVDALARVLSDPETMRFYPAPFDRAGVEEWIARNLRRCEKDGHGLWAMVLKETNELIGDCGLTIQDVDGSNEIEIGYHVRRDLWGHGFATEAARACHEFGFAHLNAKRLVSIIRPENLASRRVAEKNGMTVWKEVVRVGFQHLVYSIAR